MRKLIAQIAYSATVFTLIVGMFSSSFADIAIDLDNGAAPITSLTPTADASKNNSKYGNMPILFEQNKGQTADAVKYIARGGGYTMYLSHEGASFSLKRHDPNASTDKFDSKPDGSRADLKSDSLKMSFVGANPNPTVSGEDAAITKTNYYIGKRRIENVSNFTRVHYTDVYEGIDAVFYSNADSQLEYDFVVAPNVDANQIGLKFDGAESLEVNNNGDLVIRTANTELLQERPVAYQDIDGERHEIAASYKVTDNHVSFELGNYDRSQPIVIDPVLNYLTYIGGTAFDDVFEIAADNSGNAYISGATKSLNFHGEIREDNDKQAAYVAKINANGTAFDYLTILEGNSDDFGRGIAVDASGNAFVTGIASHFFPTTPGAYDTVHGVLNSSDVFVAKLNTSGNLVYSSFLGGTDFDEGFDVVVDASGKAYVTGNTFSNSAFPTKNRYQGCGIPGVSSLDSEDAFLTVMNAAGSDITYSTCIGGNFTRDEAFSIALDSSNNAYLTGIAYGGNFPTKTAFQANSGGGDDAWVAKFNPTLSGNSSLIYSTYLGGVGTDIGKGIAVNSSNQAVVVGLTGSANFPLQNAFRSTNQINEGFVTVLSSTGATLAASSFLGGADKDDAVNVALGSNGLIYVTGNTLSSNFPMALPFQATRAGVKDAFVTKLKFGVGVISSSYLGGNGNDGGEGIAVKGNFIYVGGQTASNNLATTSGVIKTAFGGGSNDGFVAKILDTRLDSVGVFRPNTTFVLTQSTTNVIAQNASFTAGLSGARGVSGDWDGDQVDTIGSFTDGAWKVRNSNFPINAFFAPVSTFNFGLAGDLPVVGDWDGDGIDTAGTFRPSTGQFFLTNTPNAAAVNLTLTFGLAGDLPIAGDFDGDGIDTIGVFRPSLNQWFLTNDTTVVSPPIDIVSFIGVNGDLPFAGDFNGDGRDTIGVWRPNTTEFFLTDDNVNIRPPFLFGNNFTDQPIIGDWDGRPLP